MFHVKHPDDLDRFSELLLKWNRKINLVSRSSENDIWKRHIEDSLQVWGLKPEKLDSWADLGSGGGFPGDRDCHRCQDGKAGTAGESC